MLSLRRPPAVARGQDLQSELDQTQSELDQQQDKKGVLSTELDRYGDQVDQLAGEVATLRNREAIVVAELRRVQAPPERREGPPRTSCRRAAPLAERAASRLVEIYRTGEPDLLTVMLESDGFDDLVSRYEYLRRIEEQDSRSSAGSGRCATAPGRRSSG